MKFMKKLGVLALVIALLASLCLVSCSDSETEDDNTPAEENTEAYILDMRVIEGELWVLYSNDPENPVSLGRVDNYHDGTEGLAFHPLPDGTYAVSGGTTDALNQIVIPSHHNGIPVTKIHDNGFLGFLNLQAIYIPSTVTTVGKQAFMSCTALVEVALPSTLTEIQSSAFSSCSQLTSITIPSSTQTIGEFAFANNIAMKSIVIPQSVTSIGNYAFINCDDVSIKCEAEQKPGGWLNEWVDADAEVIWGYKAEG